ncbi:hypothetical protein [Natronorubrum sp. DTA7]
MLELTELAAVGSTALLAGCADEGPGDEEPDGEGTDESGDD